MMKLLLTVAFWAGLSHQLPHLNHRQNDRAAGPLRFSSSGEFKISIFEDMHDMSLDAWSFGPTQDKKTLKVMNDVLDGAKPDLVVLNGDLITGENAFRENASLIGNHDHQFNLSGSDTLAREQQWPNGRTQSMVSGDVGVTNYYLPVYASDCANDSCTPELVLWFFDSRGGFKYQEKDSAGNQVGKPNWVDEGVVDWFKSKSSELADKYKRNLPSIAFVHIPPDASRAVQAKGIDPSKEPGINQDSPLSRQAEGWCSDGSNKASCSYGGQDKAFMQAITGTSGMLAVFSGHDHGNSWCYRWEGAIDGLSVDGSGVNLRDKLAKGELDTSIRLESGDVVGVITLNSTYGVDQYPQTPDQRT